MLNSSSSPGPPSVAGGLADPDLTAEAAAVLSVWCGVVMMVVLVCTFVVLFVEYAVCVAVFVPRLASSAAWKLASCAPLNRRCGALVPPPAPPRDACANALPSFPKGEYVHHCA